MLFLYSFSFRYIGPHHPNQFLCEYIASTFIISNIIWNFFEIESWANLN
jgi:hypothetical protein